MSSGVSLTEDEANVLRELDNRRMCLLLKKKNSNI